MKIEIPGHGRGLGDRRAGEIVDGVVSTAFESEIGLWGVNGAEKGTVAGEIN